MVASKSLPKVLRQVIAPAEEIEVVVLGEDTSAFARICSGTGSTWKRFRPTARRGHWSFDVHEATGADVLPRL